MWMCSTHDVYCQRKEAGCPVFRSFYKHHLINLWDWDASNVQNSVKNKAIGDWLPLFLWLNRLTNWKLTRHLTRLSHCNPTNILLLRGNCHPVTKCHSKQRKPQFDYTKTYSDMCDFNLSLIEVVLVEFLKLDPHLFTLTNLSRWLPAVYRLSP